MIELTMPCDSCGEYITRDEAKGHGEDFLCSWCFVPATSPEDLEHAAALDSHSVRKETPTMSILNPQWHVFRDNPLGCAIAIHTDVIHPKIIGDADNIEAEPCESISRFGPGSLTLSLNHIDDLHFDVHHVWTLYDAGFLNNDAILIFQRPQLTRLQAAKVRLDQIARIAHARDHHAEHGEYPAHPHGPDKDQCFDDWAADVVVSTIREASKGGA